MPIFRNRLCPCESGLRFKKCCGALVEDHAKRRANIYRIPATGDLIVVRRTILANLLKRDREEIERVFDERFEAQMPAADAMFSDTATLLNMSFFIDGGIDDGYRRAFQELLTSAANSLGAAYAALRSGYPLQALMLGRHVIECASTVVHIVMVPESYEDFVGGRLKSSKTINTSKKAIPILGGFYGFLSNEIVHLRPGAGLSVPKPYSETDQAPNTVLACLNCISWILYVSAEAAFPTIPPQPRYWRHRIHEGKPAIVYDPSEQEMQWLESYLGPEVMGTAPEDDPDDDISD